MSRLRTFIGLLFGAAATSPREATGSHPLWLEYERIDDVPEAAELGVLAGPDRHIVLRLTSLSREQRENLRCQLAWQLPNHSVFASSPTTSGEFEGITILKVIDEPVVVANRPVILNALRDFTNTAEDLATQMAKSLGVPPADLLTCAHRDIGRLGDWSYSFHGFECCFKHRREGTVLDVIICHGNEFGALDPYFFARFVQTSPSHREVFALLSNNYHDMGRAFTILLRLNDLQQVDLAYHNSLHIPPCRRLVLADRKQPATS